MIHVFLKNLREKNGLSQEFLASRLGISRPTYIQIEKGDRDLNISELKVLAALFNISQEDFLACRIPSETQIIVKKKETHTDTITISSNMVDKFKEVLLYILEKVGAKSNVGETVLYKLLYFIDFDYYEKYGQKLIGATYIKNLRGPTPVEFKKIVDDMEKEEEIEKVSSKFFQYEQKKYLPRRAAKLYFLNAQEEKHIDQVLSHLSDLNASQISEYSHRDIPWVVTKEGEIIDYDLVFERNKPYTDKDYLSLLSQVSGEDIVKDLGPISREEYEYYKSLPEIE